MVQRPNAESFPALHEKTTGLAMEGILAQLIRRAELNRVDRVATSAQAGTTSGARLPDGREGIRPERPGKSRLGPESNSPHRARRRGSRPGGILSWAPVARPAPRLLSSSGDQPGRRSEPRS